MSKTLNVALTDELRAFVDRNCGDGTLFPTPAEFLRSVLREKKERLEAAAARDAIVEGFEDLLAGRHVEYKGDLRRTLKEVKRRDKEGWR